MPSTFFSYGVPPSGDPSQLPDMSTLAEGMPIPWTTQEASTSANTSYQSFSNTPSAPETPPAFETSATYPQYSSSADDTPSDSAEQAASQRGYTDGFLTARIFALYSLSNLGFVGQYIQDSTTALGPTIVAPGTEDAYQSGFLCGLADGEAVVNATLGHSP